MGILNILLGLGAVAMLWLGAKVVWLSGFMAGRDSEALMWISAIDKVVPPNWQSLLIGREQLENDPEKLEMANRVFAAAYATALDHLKIDIVTARQATMPEKFRTQE